MLFNEYSNSKIKGHLRIYEEESQMKYMKERTNDQFGYFNTDLLALEKKYHERFCPDKKVSIWTLTKKD